MLKLLIILFFLCEFLFPPDTRYLDEVFDPYIRSETLVELDIEYEKLAKANGCKNYIRVEALGINEYFIDSLSNLILNKEEYKFNNNLYPPKKRCPSNFVKCPCLN